MNIERIRTWAFRSARNLIALWPAGFHRETPRSAKAIALVVVLYAALPVDLTPELLPLPSYLDDLVMLAGLSWAAIHLVPANVWDASCVQGDHWLRHAIAWVQVRNDDVILCIVLAALALWLRFWFGG
ncbi:DUF1232 domain-containing protein [Variovorax sp. LjRoot290]|uniref:YkvA family protein n=1 Tax=Variovorax sp. LjRoot290 TaxID=3342316 RepID=UPI003ECE859C